MHERSQLSDCRLAERDVCPAGRRVTGAGAVFLDPQQRLIGVWALDIVDGQVRSISSIVNPDKLTHLGQVGDYTSLLRSAR